MREGRASLVWSIKFGLWRQLKALRRAKGIDDCQVPAEQLLKHLELSGIELRERPPRPPHSTSPRGGSEGDGA